MSAPASVAWWPGGPLCSRIEPHPQHYAAQMCGQILWRDGICKGVGDLSQPGVGATYATETAGKGDGGESRG